MDHRRLTTAQVIRSGILDITCPDSRSPEDIDYHHLDVDDEDITAQELRELLRHGKALEASQYYGCWKIWKDADGYEGELFQYHVITEEFYSRSLDYAVRKAYTWYYGLE